MPRIRHFLLVIALLALLAPSATQAQAVQNLWQPADPSLVLPGERRIQPDAYQLLHIDFEALKSQLRQAPQETFPHPRGLEIYLPLPDGAFQRFAVLSSDVLSGPDRQQYPDIRTFVGRGIDDPRAVARIDFTPHGFHAMVLAAGESYWVDPYVVGNTAYYIAYRKSDLRPRAGEDYACHSVHELLDPGLEANRRILGGALPSGAQLRVYDLALTCIGEYTQFHGGTVPLALGAMVTSVNRVSGIFERDMSVRLVLVPNNDTLIFTDPNTDPYPCCNLGPILGIGADVIDSLIGFTNYDIGHTYTTYGGGLAAFGVCEAAKAIAGTGLGSPVGDPFDVDYVAHEMGHQFHCDHTFNYCTGSGGLPHEPGSGSTIMAYAGLCGSANMQTFSVDAFSVGSYEQVATFVQQGPGNTCPTIINTANTPPSVSIPQGGFYIPYGTPFELTATGTDLDQDSLTYSWEQWDLGPNTHPDTAVGNCPLFRVLWPTPNPQRIFPQIADIVQGSTTIGEKLPEYGRELNFRCAIRDNRGGADFAEMKFFVADSAGPFRVTYPNTGVGVWTAGSIQNITWDVANSDLAPVNCFNVDIYLSTDGGYTYPITLATGRPNTGATAITVPNITGTDMRVKIKGAGNHFFDISDADFAILPPSNPDYTLTVNAPVQTICGQGSTDYLIELDTIGAFSGQVSLSLAGSPGGTAIFYTSNPASTPGTVIMTISNGFAPAGDYSLTLQGNSSSGVKNIPLLLRLRTGAPTAVSLTAPFNGTTNAALTPTFVWNALPFVQTYHLQVATSPAFSSLVLDLPGIGGTSHTLASPLSNNTVYYWRVRADGSDCGPGPWATVYSFQTPAINCATYSSTNVPVVIPPPAVDTVYSTLSIPQSLLITDVNVVDLQGTHTWMDDLYFTLYSPQGTAVGLFGNQCGDQDDFWVNFDDASPLAAVPCPPTTGLVYQPDQPLGNFNGEDAQGTWTLQVIDRYAADGGSLDQWALEICGPALNANPPTLAQQLLLVNQGDAGTIGNLLLQAGCPDSNSTAIYTLVSLPAHGSLLLNGLALSIGGTFTQGDIDAGLLSYQHDGTATAADFFGYTVTCTGGGYIGGLTFHIGITPVVGLDASAATALQLFPNPAQDAVTVRLDGQQVAQMDVSVYNLWGQSVLHQTGAGNLLRLSLQDIPAGMYHVRVLADEEFCGGAKLLIRR
jgi:subtilisin-like proprotein convertase family protein